jgi:MFS family permease
VGSVSGPVIGGAFVDVNWRWILWLNIPLVITSFTGLCFFLHLQQPFPGSSIVGKLAPLDYIGTVLFLVSSTAFLLPITLAGTIAPWTSAPILVPFLLGLVGLILFFLYQRHLAHSSNPKTSPLIRLSVFSNRTTAIGHGGTFIHGILLWMILYYLPLYYEGVLGYSPLHAGIAAFPETFTVVSFP